jgi:glutaredoxin
MVQKNGHTRRARAEPDPGGGRAWAPSGRPRNDAPALDIRGVVKVTLYGKPGCHLCDEARQVVEAVGEQREFELEEVDVSSDPRLHRAYGERIPVLEVDGEELCELFVDPDGLRRRLDRVAP